MNWNLLPEIAFILIISAMSFGIAIFGWSRSTTNRVAFCFAVFICGSGIIAFTLALEMAGGSLQSHLFWYHLRYLGIGLLAPGFLVFTILYTQHERWLNRTLSILVSLESLLVLLLVYTNSLHHLVYSNAHLVFRETGSILTMEYGIVAWANWFYTVAVIVVCLICMLLHVNRTPAVFHAQIYTLIVGVTIPCAAFLIPLLTGNYDAAQRWTVFSFFFTDLCLGLAIFKFGFLRVIPYTRDVLIKNIPDSVLVLDQYDCIVDLNPAAQQMLKRPCRQVAGLPVSQVFEKLEESPSPGKNPSVLSLSSDSGQRTYEVSIHSLDGTGNNTGGKLFILHDITDHQITEKALEQSEAFHRSLVELAYDGICIIDNSNILYANQCMCNILGLPENQVTKQPFSQFIPEALYPQLYSDISTQLTAKTPRKIYESSLLHSSGKEIPVEFITSFIDESHKGDSHLLIIVRDITERKRSEARLQQLATTDDLTGCFNRRHFFALANKEFERTCRYNLELSIILMDIDHFKNINDSHGHIIGDHVLQHIATQCRLNLREWDLLARYGGEEFIVLLPDTPIKNARQTAERLRSVVQEAILRNGEQSISVTISLGVSGFIQEENLTLENLLERADQALYLAKEKGRNRVQVWSPSIHELSRG